MFSCMRVVHWVLFVFAIIEVCVVILLTKSAQIAWQVPRTIGACVLLGVIAWVATARYQLGRAFSVTPQARQLITTGLYSRIRNPIYVASPFLLMGMALVFRRWWPLWLLLVVVPLQVLRARREAAALHAAFGAEYERYRAQTWF